MMNQDIPDTKHLTPEKIAALIREKSLCEGFYACGIAQVRPLQEEKEHLVSWITGGRHGEMKYMERNIETRLDPSRLLPGARSVIMVLLNYHTGYDAPHQDVRIAKYTHIRDYHELIREKLQNVCQFLHNLCPDEKTKVCVDSSPVAEKSWAQLAGLGWKGKNTLLLNREAGSYFLLGTVITTLELDYDQPQTDHCGNCSLCITACPTGALTEPYCLDARKCISYLTIEKKGDFAQGTPASFENFIFGCDICQDVCPFNRTVSVNSELSNDILTGLLDLSARDWLEMDEKTFNVISAGSCLAQTGLERIRRNVMRKMKI